MTGLLSVVELLSWPCLNYFIKTAKMDQITQIKYFYIFLLSLIAYVCCGLFLCGFSDVCRSRGEVFLYLNYLLDTYIQIEVPSCRLS